MQGAVAKRLRQWIANPPSPVRIRAAPLKKSPSGTPSVTLAIVAALCEPGAKLTNQTFSVFHRNPHIDPNRILKLLIERCIGLILLSTFLTVVVLGFMLFQWLFVR